jgi:hypothetical protein
VLAGEVVEQAGGEDRVAEAGSGDEKNPQTSIPGKALGGWVFPETPRRDLGLAAKP